MHRFLPGRRSSTLSFPISAGGPVISADSRRKIGRAFHRRAEQYDQHALVQRRVVVRLQQLGAAHQPRIPERLLDIGCGTGSMLTALHGRYPGSCPFGLDLAFNMLRSSASRMGDKAQFVNGDAECLPFGTGVFDLVVSASTFQWLERLDTCLEECRRVLRDGGMLCVAFFGGNTLWELQESYREAVSVRFGSGDGRQGRLHRFRDIEEVRNVLSRLGFDQVTVASETEMEYHADVPELLRSIKGVGAATVARSNAGGGLGWRGLLNDMASIYRGRFLDGGVIPATYEVIYVVARCPAVN